MTSRRCPVPLLPIVCLSSLTLVLLSSSCLSNRPPVVSEPPAGPSSARPGILCTYYASATDRDADSFSFRFDWGDAVSEWSSLIGPDDLITASHFWSDAGEYAVRVMVRDARGLESGWSPTLGVTVGREINHPPRTPKSPTGTSQTTIGIMCAFSTASIDPDGDSISYQFLWQEGDTSEWTPLVPSGTSTSLEHQWQQSGVYSLRVRCRDSRGAVSQWSRGQLLRVSPLGTVKWRYQVPLADHSCPAIGTDGTIYANSESGGLLVINPDGTIKGQIATSALAPPSIADDSTVIAVLGLETSTRVCALRPDGSIRWEFGAGSDVYSAPAIDRTLPEDSCVIYFATLAGRLYALNYNGSLRWSAEIGPVIGSPAIGPDHTVYVCRFNDSLIALNPDGSRKWSLPVTTSAFSALAIAADGTIYLPTSEQNVDLLLALDPSGTTKWRSPISWSTVAPVVAQDGTVHLGSHTGAFYAISSNGRLCWSYTTRAAITSPAAVTTSGWIIFGSADSSVYCLNSKGELCWRLKLDEPVRNSPVTIGADGTIYLHTGTWLYALRGESPLAASQWPKFQHDIRNTGRQYAP
ncbi:MAG: PQQ-binding-like beta-propeller repeat protein [candidate division WOR-3 bacterium]